MPEPMTHQLVTAVFRAQLERQRAPCPGRLGEPGPIELQRLQRRTRFETAHHLDPPARVALDAGTLTLTP